MAQRDRYDLGREFQILREIAPFAVGSPQAWGYDPDGKFLGLPCFLMECLPGVALYDLLYPNRDPVDPHCEAPVMQDYAQRIAGITRLPYQTSCWLRQHLPRWPRERIMAWMVWQSRDHSHDPVFQYALSWLKERQPRPGSFVFHHSDPNPSNFLVTKGRISGIVDWEFASLIDEPLEAIGIFFGGYFAPLLSRGLGEEFCKAIGRRVEELDWFLVRAKVWETFSNIEPKPETFPQRRDEVARIVGYRGKPFTK